MKLKIHDDYTIHFPINKLCGNKISQNAGNLKKRNQHLGNLNQVQRLNMRLREYLR